MAARQTGPKAFERQLRVSAILAKRIGGASLKEIGEQESPPVSMQAIHQLIRRTLSGRITETVEQARFLELMRLDELLGAIWKSAVSGDLPAINAALSISARRSRLLGLDLQRPGWSDSDSDASDAPTVRVEIVNDPELGRVRWLEAERIRLLEAAAPDTPRTVN